MNDRERPLSAQGASPPLEIDDATLDTVAGGAPSRSHCEPDDGSGTGDNGSSKPTVNPVLMVVSNQDFWYQD